MCAGVHLCVCSAAAVPPPCRRRRIFLPGGRQPAGGACPPTPPTPRHCTAALRSLGTPGGTGCAGAHSGAMPPVHLPSASTSPSPPLPPARAPHLSHPAAAEQRQQALDLHGDAEYFSRRGGEAGRSGWVAGRRRWLGVGGMLRAGWLAEERGVRGGPVGTGCAGAHSGAMPPVHLPSASTSPSPPLPPAHDPTFPTPQRRRSGSRRWTCMATPSTSAGREVRLGGGGGGGRRRWLGARACCCVLAGWRRRGVVEEGRMAGPHPRCSRPTCALHLPSCAQPPRPMALPTSQSTRVSGGEGLAWGQVRGSEEVVDASV